jgi:ABC-type antimicrobial peptide transport system permease subunit
LAALLGMASLATCLLGAVGLYGSMAYGVSLRRREIGIRLTLGAGAAEVRNQVARAGLRLAGIGVAIGTGLTLATSWLMRDLLYGVAPIDPPTLIVAAVALMTIAFFASWLPARKAAAIDPAEALRSD